MERSRAKAALARLGLLCAALRAAEAAVHGAGAPRLRASAEQRLAASLLQVKSERRGATGSERDLQIPASLFDDFHEGESTYNSDAAPGRPRGWDPYPDKTDSKLGGIKPAVFFHESESGGPKQAFQTHYPALSDSPANRHPSAEWTVDGRGHWHEKYIPANFIDQRRQWKEPEWFDSEVKQYDGLGRPKLPDDEKKTTPAQLPEDEMKQGAKSTETFVERSVTTKLACQTAGCTASTRLQAFDGATEKAKDCKLNMQIHPTDFDDQYSGERLTYISVNGVTATNDCFPAISGCNASTQRAMFSCLQDMSLDNIIPEDGGLDVAAQISDVVDECPFQGDLLSSVLTVTCMVKNKTNEPPTVAVAVVAPVQPVTPGIPPEMDNKSVNVRVPLRCPERGCTATANAEVFASVRPYKQCLMDVVVFQTDFDAQDGTDELIEFVKLNQNTTLVENVSPGGNPCRQMWKDGTTRTEAETAYRLVQARDVTEAAKVGLVEVAAKISDSVDECAHNGYLLNGYIEVNCTVV